MIASRTFGSKRRPSASIRRTPKRPSVCKPICAHLRRCEQPAAACFPPRRARAASARVATRFPEAESVRQLLRFRLLVFAFTGHGHPRHASVKPMTSSRFAPGRFSNAHISHCTTGCYPLGSWQPAKRA
jgi:hypothetical protein